MGNNRDQMLLTFVVPCYNVEKYIQQCLDSIYACDLPGDQFEVLCVNDCSPDGTQTILEKNRQKHENLRIIVHETNKGPGGARNTGIREARGKYLWFVDADDMVVPNKVRELLLQAVGNALDVLAFNYEDLDGSKAVVNRPKVFGDTEVLDGFEFVEKSFGASIVFHMGYLVRFICRREFLMSKQFFSPEDMRYGEDTVIMLKLLFYSSRIQSTGCFAYQYWHHESSTCGRFNSDYPARLMYEYCISTSSQLLSFSNELREFPFANDERMPKKYSEIIGQYTHTHYLNMLPIYLCRSSHFNRKSFYAIIKDRDFELKPIKREMNLLGRTLLLPVIGPVLAELGAAVYKVNHKRK